MLVLVDGDASVDREKRDAEINDSDTASEEVSSGPFATGCTQLLGSLVVVVVCFIPLCELELLPWLHLFFNTLSFPIIVTSDQILVVL